LLNFPLKNSASLRKAIMRVTFPGFDAINITKINIK